MGGPSIDSGDKPKRVKFLGPLSMGNSVGAYSREAYATILEGQSEARVRAALDAGQVPTTNEAQVREWLAEKSDTRSRLDAAKETTLREREVAAAEQSAIAARTSAEEAKRASRIAAAAAVLALVAIIISLFK